MKIQSLSVHVPAGCPNCCSFCVSHMHKDQYQNLIETINGDTEFYEKEYIERLLFARDNECNTVMLTGNGEPLANKNFLAKFAHLNERLGANKFRWIEIQTSGIFLDENYAGFLRKTVGVKNISISLSDMFDSAKNAEYNQTKNGLEVNIIKTCELIKKNGFGLRLSLNMTDMYNNKTPEEIFKCAKELGADQVTFRKLYTTKEKNTQQDLWILKHGCNQTKLEEINQYIIQNGTDPRVLPFGAVRYIINGISTVIDMNCMNKCDEKTIIEDTVKYLILRPDCKLYDQWDNSGSLLF